MLAGGIIVAHARVSAAMPPLSRSFAERSERRITSRHFKASPPSPILRTSSQLLCSKTFLAQTIPPATQAMIITNFWSTACGASIMFSVFSHYVGWCVERSWHATVLRTGRGAQLFRFSERAPPPRLSQSLLQGLDSQPSAVSLCWLHLDMIWAILLDWGLCISAVWSIL